MQRFKRRTTSCGAVPVHFAAQAGRRRELRRKSRERAGARRPTRWIQTADDQGDAGGGKRSVRCRGQKRPCNAKCLRPLFTRRHEDLVQRKTVWSELAGKTRSAPGGSSPTPVDWDATAAEIKALQASENNRPVKKSRSDLIWQRFRTACDRFFARYAQRHEIARGERVAAREAICAELESLSTPAAPDDSTPQETPAELLARARSLRARWMQEIAARGVEPARAVALDQRFAAAFEQLRAARPDAFAGTDLDPEANRQRMDALVVRVEKLATSLRGPAAGDDALSPTTRLAAMLKEALASNTIGGKVDEDSRVRAALEDMRQAQSAWSRIGPVPDAIRRSLEDRFARACRAIAETGTPGPGNPVGLGRGLGGMVQVAGPGGAWPRLIRGLTDAARPPEPLIDLDQPTSNTACRGRLCPL